jgi:hypothetical protein
MANAMLQEEFRSSQTDLTAPYSDNSSDEANNNNKTANATFENNNKDAY